MRTLIFLGSLMLALVVRAEEPMERFRYLMADPVRQAQAYAAGQERIVLCGYCHGEDGNSKRPHIPNLAGQNPAYLFQSFERFANGQRSDFVMSRLAATLTPDERANIAVYFSQQAVQPAAEPVDPALRVAGQALYQRTCVSCHGERAQGLEQMPRLAGQPAHYLRHALTGFRDKDPRRSGSVMASIAEPLSDADIASLAAYLQALTQAPEQGT